MFALSSELNFCLYHPAADMRMNFDGLSGLIHQHLQGDPQSGDVFVFLNRHRNRIKLLHWQGSGFVLYYKRLERGTFQLPNYDSSVKEMQLNYTQLVMIIDGLNIQNLQQRKRYKARN